MTDDIGLLGELEGILGRRARDTVTGYEGTIIKAMVELGAAPEVAVARPDGTGKPEEVWIPAARMQIAPDPETIGFGGRP